MGQLSALKVTQADEFTINIEFFEDEVEKWLVQYINKNNEVDDTLHQQEIDLREFEIRLFENKTKHGIIVPPLREYIEKWLKKALIRITELENQEAITMVVPYQPQHIPLKNQLQESKGYRCFPSQ